MGFRRRLFGDNREAATPGEAEPDDAASEPVDPDEDERAHELELARFEQARADDLILRQQRYADRSWVPPPQGGPRRSDDGEASSGEDR